MKRYLKIALLGALVLSFVAALGCGSKETANTTGSTSGESAKQEVVYKVGTDAAYAPFESVDPSSEIIGFDIDVLSAVAAAEDFKVKFINTAWEGIIPSLTEKKNDILVSALTITEERKKEVDFSDSYFESTNYIVVAKDSPVASLADLKGKTVSVQQGTTGDISLTEFLGKDYTGIKRFKGTPEAFLELKNGKVDAAVADSGVVMEYVKNNADLNLKYIKDDKFAKENYGIAVRKGETELLAKINAGLKKIKDNGEYDKIFEKWFGAKQ
ncbi:MAG TPA: basic amino acid ABC transporter substrate-binding protein [Desulfobacteria bacterium]|nr:basic amino acid ABC transporter substrate-binding protein [Desulfobacteria bacterium]